MAMQVLEKDLHKEAEKLGVVLFQLDDIIRHAKTKCGSMILLHAMGLGNYHLEYDEWDSYNNYIDINYYINEHGVLKALAYPIVDGAVDTDQSVEVLLVSVPFIEETDEETDIM
jgi:hypothetical protein